MSKRALFPATLFCSGLAIGLAGGYALWRGGMDGHLGRYALTSTDASAPLRGPTGSGKPHGGPVASRDGTDRVAKVLESLRTWQENGQSSGYSEFYRSVAGITGLSGENCEKLLEAMKEHRMEGDVIIFPLLQWATLEPQAALGYALGDDEFKKSERILSAIIHEMAKRDMPAAKAAVERLEDEEKRDAQGAIVRLMRKNDPAGALAYAKEAGNSRAEEETLEHWAKQDPLAAAARLEPGKREHGKAVEAIARTLAGWPYRSEFERWSSGLTDPGERAVARREILTRETADNPQQAAADAAAWLAAEPEAGKLAGTLPAHIAQRWWPQASPAEISAWASSLPDGPAQDAAIREVGRLWVEQDAMAASEWLNTVPPGEARDGVVLDLVRKIVPDAPDEAFAWGRTLRESYERNQLLEQSVRHWTAKDPAAARAAIHELPSDLQPKLTEVLDIAGKQTAEE